MTVGFHLPLLHERLSSFFVSSSDPLAISASGKHRHLILFVLLGFALHRSRELSEFAGRAATRAPEADFDSNGCRFGGIVVTLHSLAI